MGYLMTLITRKVFLFTCPLDQDPNSPFFLLGTHADLDSSEEDESLPDIPSGPWVTHANEVGLPWSAEPVCMTQISAEMESEEWTLWPTVWS